MSFGDAFLLSAIVCTRDRAPQLAHCLRQFDDADVPSDRFELIVVDNNSSDHTQSVVRAFAESARFPVKYLFEGRQGLSRARNRGIAEASHPILAFTDDDCLIDRHWASTILREFSMYPSLAVLGGKVERSDPHGKPVGTRTFSDRVQISHFDELLSRMIGCNMAFSRKVFETIGPFDPLLGKGTALGSAEDLDLLYRAFKKRLTIMYSPEAVVFHAHGRDTEDSIQQVNDEYAKGRGGFYWKHVVRGDLRIAKRALLELAELGRASLVNGRRHGISPSPPRVLRNLAVGAFYRFTGG